MHEPPKGTDPSARGYEDSDVSVGRLFAFAGGVAALVIFGVVASAVVFRFFVRHQPLGPPASPFEDVRQLPPTPRLQTLAPEDLERYRAGQDQILDSYGWVDKPAGVARIPIDRAMDLLLQKGLPVRTSEQAVGGKVKTPQAAASNPQGALTPLNTEGNQ